MPFAISITIAEMDGMKKIAVRILGVGWGGGGEGEEEVKSNTCDCPILVGQRLGRILGIAFGVIAGLFLLGSAIGFVVKLRKQRAVRNRPRRPTTGRCSNSSHAARNHGRSTALQIQVESHAASPKSPTYCPTEHEKEKNTTPVGPQLAQGKNDYLIV